MIVLIPQITGYTFNVLSRRNVTKYVILDEETNLIQSGDTTPVESNGFTTFSLTGTSTLFNPKRFYVLKLYSISGATTNLSGYYKIYSDEPEKIIQVYSQNNFKEIVKTKSTFKVKNNK